MDHSCVVEIAYSERDAGLSRHSHTGPEFLCITKGRVAVSVGGRTLDAGAGSLVLLNGLEEHTVRVTEAPYHRYFLLLNNVNTRRALADPALVFLLRNGPSRVLCPEGRAWEQALGIFRRLLAEQQTPDEFSPAQMDRLTADLFVLLYRLEHRSPAQEPPSRPVLDTVARVQDYIDAHFAEDLRIAALAEQFYLNRYYLSHLFRNSTGHTLKEYLTMVRLTHARSLLLTTQLKVNEVCFQCGFNDVNRFISCFRTAFGCTPLQYRKRAQDAKSE